jgi:hypothetical protein
MTEPKITYDNGAVQSDIGIDWTLLPWDAVEAVTKTMTANCDEYGGAYGRDNWRGLTVFDHINHSINHHQKFIQLEQNTSEVELLEHLTNAACRALMALTAYKVHLDEIENNIDW